MSAVRRSLGRAGPILLVAVLVLAGCSDDPEPKFSAEPSESASGSGTPSASPTASRNELTPVETVQAWVRARNEALSSGDTNGMKALTLPSCESCQYETRPIERVHDDGGSFSTEGWTMDSGRVTSRTEAKVTVTAAMSLAGGKTRESAGADPVVYAPTKKLLTFRLRRYDGNWRISFIGYLS